MIEKLLLNLFSVFVCFFAFQLWINGRKKYSKFGRWETCVFSIISILLCISFPIPSSEGFRFDLRMIPFWLGSLYGGPVISFVLFGVTVLFRSFFGGVGLTPAILVALFQVIGTLLLHSSFIKAKSKKRVWMGTMLALASSFFLLSMMWIFGGDVSLKVIIMYTIVQTVGMYFIILSIETMRTHMKSQKHIPQLDKWEAVSQLSASLSHEIRNKMTSTKGFLQLLSEKEEDKMRVKHFQIALKELEEAEALMQDYLVFAKPERGIKERLNVEEEIQHTISILTPFAYQNHISVQITSYPFVINGNRSLFRQALMNLIKNAIEAMPNGGSLEVKTLRYDNKVQLEISDTGCGMTNEQLAKLGEPFYTSKGDQGTGLGMVVVNRVIEEMGGKVTVESESGVGTRFCLHLPIVSQLSYLKDPAIAK